MHSQMVTVATLRAQAQPGIASSLLPSNMANLLEASATIVMQLNSREPKKPAEENRELLEEVNHLLAEAGDAVFRGARVPVLLQALIAMDLLGLTHSMGRRVQELQRAIMADDR